MDGLVQHTNPDMLSGVLVSFTLRRYPKYSKVSYSKRVFYAAGGVFCKPYGQSRSGGRPGKASRTFKPSAKLATQVT